MKFEGNHSGQLPPLVRRTRNGLGLLLDARTLARGCNRDSSEFAVEMADLFRAGVTRSDIRWLVCKGYAESLVECTPKNATARQFRKSRNLRITENTCFVLTLSGLAVAEKLFETGRDVAPDHLPAGICGQPPHWDASRRQLWWQGRMIKHFRVPATNQEAVLSAFEEQGWPPRVDDPLPPVSAMTRRLRLQDTVKRLNRGQLAPLLRFLGDGTGRGVCWETQ